MKQVDAIHSSADYYYALANSKNHAHLMQKLRTWLTHIVTFDALTNEVIPTGMLELLRSIDRASQDTDCAQKDYLYHMIHYIENAIRVIIRQPQETIRTEHHRTVSYRVKKLDSKSLQWLSRQPGRNMREKLTSKSHIMSVEHHLRLDTSENRLLKACLQQLERVLSEKEATNLDEDTGLLLLLRRWLRSDAAVEIGSWRHQSPNNLLLQDKYYRKIWWGWQRLSQLDERIEQDFENKHIHLLTMRYWQFLSHLHASGHCRIVQQPLYLNYDEFLIYPNFVIKQQVVYVYLMEKNGTKHTLLKLVRDTNHKFILLKEGEPISIFSLYLSDDQQYLYIEDSYRRTKYDLHDNNIIYDMLDYIKIPTNKNYESKKESREYNHFIIDLCALRPSFLAYNAIDEQESSQPLPFRLLYQKWQKINEIALVDGGEAQALALSDNINDMEITSFSMLSVLTNQRKEHEKSERQVIGYFFDKLKTFLGNKAGTYLLPDWLDDFTAQKIREPLHTRFTQMNSLPHSIAAAFAWQYESDSVVRKIQDNHCLIIVDIFADNITLTPVVARQNQQLGKMIESTQGIYWERYPSIIHKESALVEKLMENIQKISYAKRVLESYGVKNFVKLFGLDGLLTEAQNLTLSSANHSSFYHLSSTETVKKDLCRNLPNILSLLKTLISREVLSEQLPEAISSYEIIHISEIVHAIDPIKTFLSKSQLLAGAVRVEQWQTKLNKELEKELILWKDHLPPLWFNIPIEGIYDKFYLVKENSSIAIKRGRSVAIPIVEKFILPKDKKAYQFRLSQGSGAQALEYSVYLESPDFPLIEDNEYYLKLSYRYGSAEPYYLEFKPLKNGLQPIVAQWRSITFNHQPKIPDFPTSSGWDTFSNYPKKDSTQTNDLCRWIVRALQDFDDWYAFIRSESNTKRQYLSAFTFAMHHWRDDNNKYISVNNIFFHQSNFITGQFILDEIKEKGISYDLVEQNDKKVAKAITLGKSLNLPTKWYSWRFPLLTIWKDGRSLDDQGVDDNFKKIIKDAIDRAFIFCKLEECDDSVIKVQNEAKLFLSVVHGDLSSEIEEWLYNQHLSFFNTEEAKDLLCKDETTYRTIAYALGHANKKWQQQLLRAVIELSQSNRKRDKSIALEILGIAFWRGANLWQQLNVLDMRELRKVLYEMIRRDINLIYEEKIYVMTALTFHLELLLGLLRGRGSENTEIQKLLRPHEEKIQQFVPLIDEVSKLLRDKKDKRGQDLALRTRIKFTFNKPASLAKMPDLLYALRMYLTDDDGTATISIKSIEENDT